MTREFFAIASVIVRVRRAVGIAFKGDCRHGDGWSLKQVLFKVVVLRFSLSQVEPPAIVVNDDGEAVCQMSLSKSCAFCSRVYRDWWRNKIDATMGAQLRVAEAACWVQGCRSLRMTRFADGSRDCNINSRQRVRYSARRACMGSILAARRQGTKVAATAARAKIATTGRMTERSVALVP